MKQTERIDAAYEAYIQAGQTLQAKNDLLHAVWRFMSAVFYLKQRYVTGTAQKEDAYQEGLIAVSQALDKFDARKGEFHNWVIAVADCRIVKHLRTEADRPDIAFSVLTPSTKDSTEYIDYLTMRCARETDTRREFRNDEIVPENVREIAGLLLSGLSVEAVADVLGISPRTLRKEIADYAKTKGHIVKTARELREEKRAYQRFLKSLNCRSSKVISIDTAESWDVEAAMEHSTTEEFALPGCEKDYAVAA